MNRLFDKNGKAYIGRDEADKVIKQCAFKGDRLVIFDDEYERDETYREILIHNVKAKYTIVEPTHTFETLKALTRKEQVEFGKTLGLKGLWDNKEDERIALILENL